MKFEIQLMGGLAVAFGLLARYWRDRRRFKRRNATGIETFSKYSTALFTKWIEIALVVIADLLIVIGLLLLLIA